MAVLSGPASSHFSMIFTKKAHTIPFSQRHTRAHDYTLNRHGHIPIGVKKKNTHSKGRKYRASTDCKENLRAD